MSRRFPKRRQGTALQKALAERNTPRVLRSLWQHLQAQGYPQRFWVGNYLFLFHTVALSPSRYDGPTVARPFRKRRIIRAPAAGHKSSPPHTHPCKRNARTAQSAKRGAKHCAQ